MFRSADHARSECLRYDSIRHIGNCLNLSLRCESHSYIWGNGRGVYQPRYGRTMINSDHEKVIRLVRFFKGAGCKSANPI